MSDLPPDFDCTVTNWDYVYGCCRDVADEVRASAFDPDAVVALARGGWFGGRCVCDFLGIDDLVSVKVEHYVGTAQQDDEPRVRYPLPEGAVEGKDVLVVDDVVDTGGSIRTALDEIEDRDPATVRTATLNAFETSGFEPDFVGSELDEWTWLVYPWNFVEDMVEITGGVLRDADRETFSQADVRHRLADRHDIGQVALEVAQSDRLEEVLDEMVRRGILERVDDGWRLVDEG